MHVYNGETWPKWEIKQPTQTMLEEFEDIVDAPIVGFKNYFASAWNWRGSNVTTFFTKKEFKSMLDELTELYDEMEDTDVPPAECQDIIDYYELDWDGKNEDDETSET